jgi:hypothetical protein
MAEIIDWVFGWGYQHREAIGISFSYLYSREQRSWVSIRGNLE